MQSTNISDVKIFMKKLLIDDVFDHFLLDESTITTYNTFSINGHIQKSYYTDEEYEQLKNKDFTYWEAIKPMCFNIIKGKKTPLSFKIILKLDPEATLNFINEQGLNNDNIVSSLYININYENMALNCISATSYKSFSLDKTIENAFDKYIEKFLLALI